MEWTKKDLDRDARVVKESSERVSGLTSKHLQQRVGQGLNDLDLLKMIAASGTREEAATRIGTAAICERLDVLIEQGARAETQRLALLTQDAHANGYRDKTVELLTRIAEGVQS